MSLADFVDRLVPSWAKQPARQHWWSMFRLASVLVDVLVEGVYQGRKAGMPLAVDLPGVPGYGGFEDVKSLDMIGRDVGVLHGLTESPPDYAYRCRHYLDGAAGGWEVGGLVEGVLEQLAGILGPTPPLMRIVNRYGDWWTRLQDGTFEFARVGDPGIRYNIDGTTEVIAAQGVPFDWDSLTDPAPASQGEAGDWFLILYVPIDTPYGTVDDLTFADPGIVGDAWNDPTIQVPIPSPWAGTVGTNAPIVLVELIQSVIAQRAAAGWNCLWIIEAHDPDSFDPYGSSAVYPDGHWGHCTKFDVGSNSRIPSRLATAEYWAGAVGGTVL